MPGCIVSAMTASFISVENRRRRATPVITSTFENVSDIGVYLGLCLGPPAKAGVRSKQGAVHIRYQVDNLTIKNSYFHDNQDGILGAANLAGNITIINSEFSHNGTGDGQTQGTPLT